MPQASLHADARASTALDRHFELPAITHVRVSAPLTWLRRGWRDLCGSARLSVAYGQLFALAGSVLLLHAAPRPHLFTAALCGFMLVAPLLAAAFHEISRRMERGQSTRLLESLDGWSRNGGSMALLGLALVLVALAWQQISTVLFALFYGGNLPTVQAFFAKVFLSGDYLSFVLVYAVTGGILAAAVFATSALAVPMLVDRRVDVATAVATSLKAMRVNPAAMAAWALALVVLMLLAFATLPLGVMVLFPWAAHASWHAYRDLTRD
jgi:uncharacterized membrane protein